MGNGVRLAQAFQLVVRELEVMAVHDLSPSLRRIEFSGPDLQGVRMPDGFELDPMRSAGFDDCVLLLFPDDGDTETAVPMQLRGRTAARADGRTARRRAYTVRRWDADRNLLTLEFVLHGHGLAARWAAGAVPGDRLYAYGPSTGYALPYGVDWIVAAGDETGLPSLARLLDDVADGTAVHVLIEVRNEQDVIELPARTRAEVTWLFRGSAAAQESTLLLDALRALPKPPGPGFAWVAAETTVVRGIRRFLRTEWEMPKSHMEAWGYWRFDPQGLSDFDEHAADHVTGPDAAAEGGGVNESGSDPDDDHYVDDMDGVASALVEAGLLDHARAVQVHSPGAQRIAWELRLLRPDLAVVGVAAAPASASAGQEPDTVIWQLPESSSRADIERGLAEASALTRSWSRVVLVVPADDGDVVQVPDSATRLDLGWVGTAIAYEGVAST